MGKLMTSWVCKDCGNTQTQWSGNCSGCKSWNTIEKFIEAKQSRLSIRSRSNKAIRITEIKIGEEERFSSGFSSRR